MVLRATESEMLIGTPAMPARATPTVAAPTPAVMLALSVAATERPVEAIVADPPPST